MYRVLDDSRWITGEQRVRTNLLVGSLGGIQACASFGGCEAGLFAIPEGKCLSIAECSDKDESKSGVVIPVSSSVIFVFCVSVLFMTVCKRKIF